MPNHIARITEIYNSLPKIECKKKCTNSCGPIAMSEAEWKRLTFGDNLHCNDNLECPFLEDGLCSIYNRRPLICRLFGLVRKMKCPYGCIPEKWLSDSEAYLLLDDLNGLIPNSEPHFILPK